MNSERIQINSEKTIEINNPTLYKSDVIIKRFVENQRMTIEAKIIEIARIGHLSEQDAAQELLKRAVRSFEDKQFGKCIFLIGFLAIPAVIIGRALGDKPLITTCVMIVLGVILHYLSEKLCNRLRLNHFPYSI